jgi:F0F1-type ATP synthase membrane subunit b/b'
MTDEPTQDNVQPPEPPPSDGTQKSEPVKSIPYDRFKQVNDQKNELAKRLEALEQAEQERQRAKLEAEGKYQEIIDNLKPEAERAKTLEEQLKQYHQRDQTELDAELDLLDETMKSLVPQGDPSMQLAWVRNARRAGLFDKAKPPVTESGATGDRKAHEEPLTPGQQRVIELARDSGFLRSRKS